MGLKKLSPEVLVPQPQNRGAIVILVAFFGMFSALTLSAFALRAQAHRSFVGGRSQAPVIAVTSAGETELFAIPPAGPIQLSQAEHRLTELFRHSKVRGSYEEALQAYSALPTQSPARGILSSERERLAKSYLQSQLGRLIREIGVGACEAARERIARLQRLLPDTSIDTAHCQRF